MTDEEIRAGLKARNCPYDKGDPRVHSWLEGYQAGYDRAINDATKLIKETAK